MSVTEQRYQAVLDVIAEGRAVMEVASQWTVSRRTVHRWLARYEAAGLEGLPDRSHRPERCPHQMPAAIEVMVLELRRAHRYWGARRLALELGRKQVTPAPSESAVYRCLVRAGVIDPVKRHRRKEIWKRWERGGPMELWQMDLVGGFLLADGTSAKALTGIDDHSRFCVSAGLMPREGTQLVCDGFLAAMRAHGVPQQVLTDNGKVFTGKYAKPPVDVLFDRLCRENGIDHLLTQPASPTTTGKIERFHRTLRIVRQPPAFASLAVAQQPLDEWVTYYNTEPVFPRARFCVVTVEMPGRLAGRVKASPDRLEFRFGECERGHASARCGIAAVVDDAILDYRARFWISALGGRLGRRLIRIQCEGKGGSAW